MTRSGSAPGNARTAARASSIGLEPMDGRTCEDGTVPKSKGRQARRKKSSSRARRTQLDQYRAERSARTRSYASYRRRRAAAWGLIGAGIVIGISHWFEHFGLIRIFSQGVEDLLLGYPMAALLTIFGLMLLPPSWTHYRSK